MRKSCLFALTFVLATPCFCGANYSEELRAAAEQGKTTYVMFHRGNNRATQQMAQVVESVVKRNGEKSTWLQVSLADPEGAELVRRFDATRVPMPAVFGVAPNGAVTGVYRMKVHPKQLHTALLTRGHADMVKALQGQKIVVVVFQPATGGSLPAGVQEFCQNSDRAGQVQLIEVHASDSEEAAFFNRMKVNSQLTSPVVRLFVPPGNHLGTFNGNVSASILDQKVCNSGKCNCEKCQRKRRNARR